MNTNVLLSTAAVGLLVAGGAAYTMRSEPARSDQRAQVSETKPPPRSRVERVMDPAGVSSSARADQARIAAQDQAQKSVPTPNTEQPPSAPDTQKPDTQKNVRVVYPNGQSSGTQAQPAGQTEPSTPPPSVTPSPTPAPVAVSDNTQTAPPSTTPAPQPAQPAQPSTQPAIQSSKGIVALNTQQQTQVGQAIAQRNITPLTSVNFSIAIGTQVPRSVQLRALPSDLVAFVPDYRGYSYFVVEEQIMIVEPASHEIVAIVPYTGAGAAAPPSAVAKDPAPTNSRPVSLNTEQREVGKKHGKERRANKPVREPNQTAEEPAPRSMQVETEIEPQREASPPRRNRFIREDDDVMLIDPDENRIIEQRRPLFGIEQPRPLFGFGGWR